jgi:hypothetical protein
LLGGHFGANLAKGLSKRTIGVCRSVARNEDARTDDPNPGKRQDGARRHLEWLRQHQTKLFDAIFNGGHSR